MVAGQEVFEEQHQHERQQDMMAQAGRDDLSTACRGLFCSCHVASTLEVTSQVSQVTHEALCPLNFLCFFQFAFSEGI